MKLQLSFRFCTVRVLLALLITCSASSAYADCSTDPTPDCTYVGSDQAQTITPGAFVNNGQKCALVTNYCSNAIMVPTGSQTEWNDFLASNLVNQSGHCVYVSGCNSLSVNLSANPTSVAFGSPTLLTWIIANNSGPVSCTNTSTDSPTSWPQAGITASGSKSVTPDPSGGTGATTYTLTCSDNVSKNVGSSAPVTVTAGANCNGTGYMAEYDSPNLPCASSAPEGTICYSMTDKCTPVQIGPPVCTENKLECENGVFTSVGCIGGGCGT